MGASPSPQPQDESHEPESPPFSPEQVAHFEKRYKEEYDVHDPEYKVWLKLYHTNSIAVHTQHLPLIPVRKHLSEASAVVSDILVLPKPSERWGRKSGCRGCVSVPYVIFMLCYRNKSRRKVKEVTMTLLEYSRNCE